MAKEKTFFVQGDSSDDDDKPLVMTSKTKAPAAESTKQKTPRCDEDDVPLQKKHPKLTEKTSKSASLKRSTSPSTETAAPKPAKKTKTNESTTTRKKKAATEIPDDAADALASTKLVVSHKTKRFDSAIASLLLDSISHPLFASHLSQALDTCRSSKTDSGKLHEVLDAVQVKAMEFQSNDDAANTALANVR